MAKMKELSKDFPPGLEYTIIYNPTEFISESLHEVYKTLVEAIILVALVVLIFLQNWRAAVIPILAIPVSLIGTFFVMSAFGFNLNVLPSSEEHTSVLQSLMRYSYAVLCLKKQISTQ